MSHKEAIDQLRREGFEVDNNPDLMDCLHTTSYIQPEESAKLQSRYWDLRKS